VAAGNGNKERMLPVPETDQENSLKPNVYSTEIPICARPSKLPPIDRSIRAMPAGERQIAIPAIVRPARMNVITAKTRGSAPLCLRLIACGELMICMLYFGDRKSVV